MFLRDTKSFSGTISADGEETIDIIYCYDDEFWNGVAIDEDNNSIELPQVGDYFYDNDALTLARINYSYKAPKWLEDEANRTDFDRIMRITYTYSSNSDYGYAKANSILNWKYRLETDTIEEETKMFYDTSAGEWKNWSTEFRAEYGSSISPDDVPPLYFKRKNTSLFVTTYGDKLVANSLTNLLKTVNSENFFYEVLGYRDNQLKQIKKDLDKSELDRVTTSLNLYWLSKNASQENLSKIVVPTAAASNTDDIYRDLYFDKYKWLFDDFDTNQVRPGCFEYTLKFLYAEQNDWRYDHKIQTNKYFATDFALMFADMSMAPTDLENYSEGTRYA